MGKWTVEPPNDEQDHCVRDAEVELVVHAMQHESGPRPCVRARFWRETGLNSNGGPSSSESASAKPLHAEAPALLLLEPTLSISMSPSRYLGMAARSRLQGG